MARKPVIGVVGTGDDREPAVSNARDMGTLIAEQGWVLISGGRDAGVMRAACAGAKSAGGLTIGILPDAETDVSTHVDLAIVTDTGEARNNIIVLSADVVVACGVEGPGTASEIALALKNGTPVILLAADEVAKNFFMSLGGERLHLANSCAETIATVRRILKIT